MSTVVSPPARVKPAREPLGLNEERTVSLRDAIYHVRTSPYVAFGVQLNEQGNHTVVDVTRALALRTLRKLKGRVRVVLLRDIFGTLVIG